MPQNPLEHQASHQTEADDGQLDYQTKVDVMTRYTEKMGDTHPQVLEDLILLNQHRGRDGTDWNNKFIQHDLPAQYTQAFKLSTADMDDHQRDYAAAETAQALTAPLESKLQDFVTQVTYSNDHDKLDPVTHKQMLNLTAKVTHNVLNDCRHTLAEALMHQDKDELQDAMTLAAHARHQLDKANEGRTYTFQTRHDPEAFKDLADHRQELMEHRFTNHLKEQHPGLEHSSPADASFRKAFREFAKDYLEPDVEKLAMKYSQQSADLTVHFSQYDNTQDFSEAWQNERIKALRDILHHQEDSPATTYRELLAQQQADQTRP